MKVSKELKNMNLPQRLIERLNSEVFEMSYTLIAEHLLRNYDRLKNITIKEVCDCTFVSKSTLRRFCNHLGYKNFTELKQSYIELKENNILSHTLQRDEYLKVFQSVLDINRVLVNQIIHEIKSKKYIFFIFPYDLYAPFYEFQREMLNFRKLIHLMPNIDRHYEDIKHFLDEALVFIVDFDDTYLDMVTPYLNKVHSTNILFTNHHGYYGRTFLTIPFHHFSIDSLRKYQLALFLDTIIYQYAIQENV